MIYNKFSTLLDQVNKHFHCTWLSQVCKKFIQYSVIKNRDEICGIQRNKHFFVQHFGLKISRMTVM